MLLPFLKTKVTMKRCFYEPSYSLQAILHHRIRMDTLSPALHFLVHISTLMSQARQLWLLWIVLSSVLELMESLGSSPSGNPFTAFETLAVIVPKPTSSCLRVIYLPIYYLPQNK